MLKETTRYAVDRLPTSTPTIKFYRKTLTVFGGET